MHESAPVQRTAFLGTTLLVITLGVYWPSANALWGYWTDPESGGTHGTLIALLSAWLMCREWRALTVAPMRPSGSACGLLLLCSVAWLIFWRAGIQDLQLLLLPVLMFLAVFAGAGSQAARVLAFPLGYLYFSLPVWGSLGEPLQGLTTRAVAVLAPLMGLPTSIRDNIVSLPGGGAFEIARGCSGINFLVVGLAVAALMGELEKGSLGRRAFLLGAMGSLAVVCNWIRVLVIIAVGYSTNMRHVLVTRGHLLFGWALFALVLIAFVWMAGRNHPRGPHHSRVPTAARTRRGTVPGYLSAVVTLAASPLLVYTLTTEGENHMASFRIDAAAGHAGWRGPMSAADDAWQPVFVGPHEQWHLVYEGAAGHNVEMVAIAYPMQEQGRELVNDGNSLLGAGGLVALSEGVVTPNGRPYREVVAVDDHGRRSIVWSVYDIGGHRFVVPLLSQLWYGVRSLGGAPHSVLFAFRMACEQTCNEARATLAGFLQVMSADLFASVASAPPKNIALKPV